MLDTGPDRTVNVKSSPQHLDDESLKADAEKNIQRYPYYLLSASSQVIEIRPIRTENWKPGVCEFSAQLRNGTTKPPQPLDERLQKAEDVLQELAQFANSHHLGWASAIT